MTNRKTEGLIAAPFTPLRADGSLNLDAVEHYARWLHQNRVVGAFICGTTGEGMSLTLDERRQLAERWVTTAPSGLRVIVHVGHNALADCQALAAHAQSIGADSIACLSPFFFKPAGVEGLVDWCEQVAAAAPRLPFYYYHMPSMTGVSVKVYEFLRLASRRIPNLAGIKFTFEDLEDFQRCLQLEDGRFDVLFGRDELLLSALKLGARGAVGSTYNYAAPLYCALIAACEQGDAAKAADLQALAVRMINAFLECGAQPIAAFKWFMGQVAVECGPVRLPLRNPSGEQIATLEAKLEASGIFEWVQRRSSATVAAHA
jgi:N-acetylneuraminate lyase